jgi:hypothetical protein
MKEGEGQYYILSTLRKGEGTYWSGGTKIESADA